MSRQGWVECYTSAQVDGPAVVSTTTNTSILPSQAKWTLPNEWFDAPGKTLRITARGRATANATTPGTLTLDIRFGGNIIANTGAMTLNTTQINNTTWEFEALLVARNVGSAANLMIIGSFNSALVGSGASSGSTGAQWIFPGNTAAVSTGTLDTTAAQQIDLQATWSVNNANNTLTLHQYILEGLN